MSFEALFAEIEQHSQAFADEHIGILRIENKPIPEDEETLFGEAAISVQNRIKVFAQIYHPLDKDAVEALSALTEQDPYQKFDDAKKLWKLLVKKSIECLRYYDRREPFLDKPNKVPMVYGESDLNNYFESFVDFESLLYGSSPYYRDHVVHTLYVWELGLEQLLTNDSLMEGLKASLHSDIKDHVDSEMAQTTQLEIISMWTLAALCHDLGYPLEKARKIIDKTQSILNHFIKNAQIPFSVNFTGIQNEMNNVIVKTMSSKLKPIPFPHNSSEKETTADTETTCGDNDRKEVKQKFLVRIQPKYFMKFAASLEQYDHGIISALILYKLLMYFKESEFAMNEDYTLNAEGARQFYIRRELLRAISAHTCTDIYHMSSFSLSFLLHVCDDMQSWDRKSFRDMHSSKSDKIQPSSKFSSYTNSDVCIEDAITYTDFIKSDMRSFFDSICGLMDELQKRYRDGPETVERLFSFTRKFTINIGKPNKSPFPGLEATLCIPNSEAASIKCEIKNKNEFKDKKEYIKDYIDELNKNHSFKITIN